jgi:hypothetical protein
MRQNEQCKRLICQYKSRRAFFCAAANIQSIIGGLLITAGTFVLIA